LRPPHGIDAVWLASPLLVAALLALLSPVRPFDYFWSLVHGRALVELGHVPDSNLFLFTLPSNAPFFDQPWLGQLLMYASYASLGHAANVVVFAACLVAALAIVLDAALRLGARPVPAALSALGACIFIGLGSGVRTQMFAYPCFAVVFTRLALAKSVLPARTLGALIVSTALWANLHGSFVLAPVLVGLHLLAQLRGDDAGRWMRLKNGALAVVLVLLAACANPQGSRIFMYALHLGGAMQVAGQSDVAEWQPLAWSSPQGVLFALAVLGGALLLLRRWRTLPLGALLGWIVFALLSLKSQRFLCWWALISVVTLSPAFPIEARAARPQRANSVLLILFAAITLCSVPGLPLFNALTRATHLPYAGARVFGPETPVRLLEALARARYRGHLFHAQAVGGYVEWMLGRPEQRAVAFVDQRFELTPPELWRDYFALSEASGDWPALLSTYEIDALLIDVDTQPKLARAVAELPQQYRLLGSEFSYRLYRRVTDSAAASDEPPSSRARPSSAP
jgi:hypothetical protein